MKTTPRCIVCDQPTVHRKGHLCTTCGEAYDRWNRRSDGTHLGLIAWAAARARRFERRGRRRAP